MKHAILVVDDDSFVLNTLQKQFDDWDIEFHSARDPESAKDILAKVVPDLILLDVLLTKTDGAEGVLDFIKSQPRLENVPVIALTNLDKPELKQLLLEQGVKEYIIKGEMSLDDIYNKVRSYLEPSN